jgi:hypothetical protein
MSQLAPDARRLVATSGANIWFPAVTDEELTNEQLLIDNYRRTLGGRRVAYSILGLVAVSMLWSYVRGSDRP